MTLVLHQYICYTILLYNIYNEVFSANYNPLPLGQDKVRLVRLWCLAPLSTIFQLYHGESRQCIVLITPLKCNSCDDMIVKMWLLVKSEWLMDCCFTPIQQFFSYIMARTSLFSTRWRWGPLCTRPTRLVWFS
jgi:hypothetical protein